MAIKLTPRQVLERAWAMRAKGIAALTDEPIIVQDSNMWLRLATDEPVRWFWSEYEAERGY